MVLTLETRSLGGSRQASTNSLVVSSAALTHSLDASGNSASRRPVPDFVASCARDVSLPLNLAVGDTVGGVTGLPVGDDEGDGVTGLDVGKGVIGLPVG